MAIHNASKCIKPGYEVPFHTSQYSKWLHPTLIEIPPAWLIVSSGYYRADGVVGGPPIASRPIVVQGGHLQVDLEHWG